MSEIRWGSSSLGLTELIIRLHRSAFPYKLCNNCIEMKLISPREIRLNWLALQMTCLCLFGMQKQFTRISIHKKTTRYNETLLSTVISIKAIIWKHSLVLESHKAQLCNSHSQAKSLRSDSSVAEEFNLQLITKTCFLIVIRALGTVRMFACHHKLLNYFFAMCSAVSCYTTCARQFFINSLSSTGWRFQNRHFLVIHCLPL